MKRPLAAIVGGLVGTTAMSLVLAMMEVQTRSAIGIFAVIARYVRLPGRLWLGFLVFIAVGTVIWPLLLVGLERYLSAALDPAVKGMALAAVLWIPFVLTGRGDLTGPILLLYGAVTLVAHLLYGFTMGAVYARLSDHSRFRPG